jgi:O-antigen ligase
MPKRILLRVILVIGVLNALNLPVVHGSSLAAVIAVIVAVFSALDGYCWAAFMATSQIVADPQGLPLTLAQLGVVAWAVTLPLNSTLGAVKHIRCLWSYIAPLTVWIIILEVGANCTWGVSWFVGPITFLIAGLYFLDPRTEGKLALKIIVLSAGTAALGYWLPKLGVSVLGITYAASDYTLGFARTGYGRGDSNNAAINVVVFLLGATALTIFSETKTFDRRVKEVVFVAACWALGIPALLATVSRGGLYAIPLGLLVILLIYLRARGSSAVGGFLAVGCVIVLAASSVVFFDAGAAILGKFGETRSFVDLKDQSDVTSNTVGPNFLAGRSQIWLNHLDMMIQYPLTGIRRGENWTFPGAVGGGAVGVNDFWFAAHNVFIEYGSRSGILGCVLFLVVFYRAPRQLWRRAGLVESAPYLCVIVAIGLMFLSFSVTTWKTLWLVLALIWTQGLRSRGRSGLGGVARPAQQRAGGGYSGDCRPARRPRVSQVTAKS